MRVEDARFQQSLFAYQNTVLKAAQEVEDGIDRLPAASRRPSVFAQNAATAALDSVKLAITQYREGAVDFQRVLDAQRSLLQSQNTLARTRSAVATNLVALYKALGGGWELRQDQPFVTESTRIEMQKRTNWGSYLMPQPSRSAADRPTAAAAGAKQRGSLPWLHRNHDAQGPLQVFSKPNRKWTLAVLALAIGRVLRHPPLARQAERAAERDRVG